MTNRSFPSSVNVKLIPTDRLLALLAAGPPPALVGPLLAEKARRGLA